MRWVTIILGIIGMMAAVSGIWNVLFDWLMLLGVIIPPIGTIIIIDQLILVEIPMINSSKITKENL